MPSKRTHQQHPHREERLCDRAHSSRARSRVLRRTHRGRMVKNETGGVHKEDSVAAWRMSPGKEGLSKQVAGKAGIARTGSVSGNVQHDVDGSATAAGESMQACREEQVPEPLTEELLHELRSASSPIAFTAAHDITHRSLSDYLNQLLVEKGLRRVDVVRAAGINETFGYQIFKGQRSPSRDKVLQLAFAMGCDLIETNRLLKAAGVNELYCKNRRDAIIIFCIDHEYTLQRTDEELYRFGEKTLAA